MSSLNTTVGAFQTNTKKIKKAMLAMDDAQCDIGCFHECTIPGYSSEDLVLWDEYVSKQEEYLVELADLTSDLSTYYFVGFNCNYNGLIYNAAALIGDGNVIAVIPKEELPTYDVFYDGRQFTAGIPNYVDTELMFGDIIFDMPWGKTAIVICEDIWTNSGPINRRSYSGAELIFNLSASPWRHGVLETRKNLIKTRSEDNQIALVYVNQFGGNDSLVFDGGCMIAQNGDIVYQSPRWEEFTDYYTIDLEQVERGRKQNTTWRNNYNNFIQTNPLCYTLKVEPKKLLSFPEISQTNQKNTSSFFMPDNNIVEINDRQESINTIITGLNDYYEKTNVFQGIGIGLSGGRDSMLTAILAAEWAARTGRDPKIIKCFSMPSKYNSDTTKSLAKQMAEYLGVDFIEIPIQETYEKELECIKLMSKKDDLKPLTIQNMQARVRGMRMWNISNELDLLWLQTGNMSEKSVGYTTIGGDMMGGFSLLGNVPKTVINKILRDMTYEQDLKISSYVNIDFYHLLYLLMETKASAELADDQQDERDLMPFDILDLCYYLLVKEKKNPQDIYDYLNNKFSEKDLLDLAPNYEKGMLKNWVVRFIQLFFRNIYKWVQCPEAIHMGPIDLDRERALQLPSVTSLEWLDFNIIGEK